MLEVACLVSPIFGIAFLMSIDLHLPTYESHNTLPMSHWIFIKSHLAT